MPIDLAIIVCLKINHFYGDFFPSIFGTNQLQIIERNEGVNFILIYLSPVQILITKETMRENEGNNPFIVGVLSNSAAKIKTV